MMGTAASLGCSCWDDPSKIKESDIGLETREKSRSPRKHRLVTDSEMSGAAHNKMPSSIDLTATDSIGINTPMSLQQVQSNTDSEHAASPPDISSPLSPVTPHYHTNHYDSPSISAPRTPSKIYKIVISPSPDVLGASSFSEMAATVPEVPDLDGDEEWDE